MKTPPPPPLREIYRRLYRHFGPQHWWPGDTPFEVAVGAVLTQSTAWSNVEQAISRLKTEKVLSVHRLAKTPLPRLAGWIRPAGYFRVKAKRLKALVVWWAQNGNGTRASRQELLSIYGVGPETADSILLYAFNRPIFVVDAYTKRILSRHGWIARDADYNQIQAVFHRQMPQTPQNAKRFNEFHALIVALGKDYCRKSRPKCSECPLKGLGVLTFEKGVVPV